MIKFDDLEFKQHIIPIGYDIVGGKRSVTYRKTIGAKVNINDDTTNEEIETFIDALPVWYYVQIGNTFYQKRGRDFVDDLLYMSADFEKNLKPMVITELWVYMK